MSDIGPGPYSASEIAKLGSPAYTALLGAKLGAYFSFSGLKILR